MVNLYLGGTDAQNDDMASAVQTALCDGHTSIRRQGCPATDLDRRVGCQRWIPGTTGALRRHARAVLADDPVWSRGVQGGQSATGGGRIRPGK